MAKKKPAVTNAMRMIHSAKLGYELIEYEADEVGSDFGMTIAEKINIAPEQSFKTLVMRGEKTGIAVACVPCCDEVDLKKMAKVCGDKKMEMIHVKELLGLTGYIRGSVSPIGMKKHYPTYINSSAKNFERIVISAGMCGASLLMKPEDIQKITDCTFADIVK